MPSWFKRNFRIAPILLLCAFQLLMFAHVAIGQQITKRVGIVSLYPYQPNAISGLNQLPPTINEKLAKYLVDRLGNEFLSKLEFSYGSVVNFDDLYRVNPGARDYQWQVFAFKIGFTFSDRNVGIKLYEAEVWLDKNGDIVREIDLPSVGKNPEKARLISVREAKKISNQHKFRPERVELVYREKKDSIAWRMVRYNEGTTWWLYISAHSGEGLEKVGMTPIVD